MRFLYCDANVTPEMKEKISKLLIENLEKLNHQNPALFLQQLLNKNFEKKWFVYMVYSPVELEYQVISNTSISMDIEIEKTRFILAQFEEVSIGTFQKDKFNKTCQQIERYIQQQSQDLASDLNESLKSLENHFGLSCHMILVKCIEQETQLQYIAPNLHQYTFKIPINELESIQGGIFYIPLGAEVDDGMQGQHHQNMSGEEEFDNNQIRDENYIQDEYEEPMDLQFQVMLEAKEFKQSTDQVKVSFDELEIQPLKVHSFSILFQIIISPFPKEIKDDLNVLSTGSSLMSKNMTFGINRDQLFFFNFQLMTGKMETLYSQMKIKRNLLYQIALIYTETETYKEVSMYINGAIENQINLSQHLEPPRGFFWIGSEQALKLFKGTLRDIVFVSQALHQKHVKSIYAELQSALAHKFQRQTIEIVDEILQQFKEEIPIDQDESKFTQTQSMLKQQSKTLTKASNKKLQIPPHLQRSYHVFEEIDKKKTQQQEQPHQKTIQEFANRLKEVFQQNEIIYHKCHELSLIFYWVFTTVQQLAPPLEENAGAKLPFEYIHQELCKERFEVYPYYAIEFDRFCKVVQYSGIQLSYDDIYQLAEITDSLRENKRFGLYIIYDRLLLSIRQAALNEQEIEEVKSQYNTDEKEADQDLIIYTRGISRSKQAMEHNFSFFEQLIVLVGSENEAFKYNIKYLLAYFVNNDEFVQKLTAVYIHKETEQEVEIEGIDLFSYDQDKIFQIETQPFLRKLNPKYFRVHYNGENMAMISFKTHEAEETFRIDKTFSYREGQDANWLAGFRGRIVKKDEYSQIIMLAAEYLQKDPEVEQQKRNQPETLPQLAENWNQGKFQIIINRCSDCDKHKTTTWHNEADFANKFNEIGQILKDLFPNIEVIGNWDKTQQLEHFDVYIRGIGQSSQMDKEGRVFLFKKNEKLVKFLDCFLKRMLKVYDEIVLTAQAYGDTNSMAIKQEQFLRTNNYSQRSKIAHDHPCNVPEKQEKSEKGEAQYAGSDFICKNWGCGQPYKFDATPNGIKTCKHHPGRYEFGSKHGLWPECWTCCGKKWEAEGCKLEYHKGVPEKDFYNICINVGPLDPRTGFPEGTCGMKFQDGDSSECKYNSGTHQAAKWPDPAAKVYFVQKLHINPAQKEKETQPNKNIQVRPDVFRETKPYYEFINKDRQRQMKLIETEKELRICTNWACGKQYREIENRKKNMCRSHPGVFDFGHTATKIQEAIEEYKQEKGSKILWKPHWTCCRKSWNEPGCLLSKHSGPLVIEYKPNKYLWPDPKAQIYFKKKVSENWTKMLEQSHSLTPETASLKYDLLCKTLGSGGQISVYKLPELCDKFELNLWVCSEDLAFQFKFTDIMEGRAQEYLADTSGNIDKHKFLDWWFADVNRMLEISSK
ncbi:unnamed protein product (macronuclear) [Paramecium tetraurelia]|uniref:CHORD domain-containing protein n=1 Tax=Paramecium tetraurelia TaxID=5888 RepID=A0DEC9_PARTE|nr:uncharacterized protein GSPATT00016222001 [Paramecium tetraurelia]CAK81396.1 unnamed protein product [Paramecium tetraurelia]|eukprot:XP_001448793.1 hypothetical protein (macronuclear) [Paramecium tetraurelia strain d4-2]